MPILRSGERHFDAIYASVEQPNEAESQTINDGTIVDNVVVVPDLPIIIGPCESPSATDLMRVASDPGAHKHKGHRRQRGPSLSDRMAVMCSMVMSRHGRDCVGGFLSLKLILGFFSSSY